jgi:hypothetical protein
MGSRNKAGEYSFAEAERADGRDRQRTGCGKQRNGRGQLPVGPA